MHTVQKEMSYRPVVEYNAALMLSSQLFSIEPFISSMVVLAEYAPLVLLAGGCQVT